MIVVLPTPGPPVITRHLEPSAVSTARAQAGARRLPARASAVSTAWERPSWR